MSANLRSQLMFGLGLLGILACFTPAALAQPKAAPPKAADADDAPPSSLFKSPQFRKMVPGVERLINPERSFKELSSRHDVVEIPDYEWAKDVQFRHDIWALEFTFKPIRMIEVDLPAPGGKLRKKLIWYMVYRVKNPGIVWHDEPSVYTEPERTVAKKAEGEFEYVVTGRDALTEGKTHIIEEFKDKPVRFTPTFLLYSRDREIGKQYTDRIIAAAQKPIQEREDQARALKNSIEMTGDIPASPEGEDRSEWGVVTWEDIDPRTDFFSIYIQGLTNAFQRKHVPGKGWWYAHKTLRLDFHRFGDEFFENEDEIRFLRSSWSYLDANWSPSPDSPAHNKPQVMVKE